MELKRYVIWHIKRMYKTGILLMLIVIILGGILIGTVWSESFSYVSEALGTRNGCYIYIETKGREKNDD